MFISKYTSQLKDKLRENDSMASAKTKLLLDPSLNKTVIGNLESQLQIVEENAYEQSEDGESEEGEQEHSEM